MKFEDVQLTGSLNVTGSFNVPVHADYPTATSDGDLFYHSVSSSLFVRNDDEWVLVPFSSSTAAEEESEPAASADIEYLVVAGGGGSDFGGGGAGGFLSSSLSSIESGSSITVSVGAGGAPGTGGNVRGVNGGDSSIASSTGTTFTTVTSTGGGGSGGSDGSNQTGADGGSGGGGGLQTNNVSTVVSGGSGTTGQGNDGGTGYYQGTPFQGGGGGGAGAAGTRPNGGNGKASSITGTSTTYAGGGGGTARSLTVGTGGTGGGGDASSYSTGGNNGTANTGGGGGGFRGGTGGSGVVILAYDSGSINAWGGQEGDAGGGRRYQKFNASGTLRVGGPGEKNLPTGSLFCHYNFAEVASYGGTGTTLTDLSGNSNNATLTSANFVNTYGGGTELAGARYFTTSYTGNTIGNVHSTSIWVYLNSFDGDFVGWSTKVSAVGFGNYNFFIDAAGDVLYGDKNTSNAFQGARPTAAVSAGNLYHLVGTQDWVNGESKVYINGVLSDTNSSFAGSFRNDYGSVVWFARPFSEANNRADATIYNAMIYQRVLSQSDVTQIYNAQKPRFGL